jgi:hypothetical protein
MAEYFDINDERGARVELRDGELLYLASLRLVDYAPDGTPRIRPGVSAGQVEDALDEVRRFNGSV